MMKTKHAHQNKFLRIITMPIKALAKARDFYVKSMNNYADKVCYSSGSGLVGSGYYYSDTGFPRSFSTTSSTRSNDHDDFKELVRAASTSTLGNRVDVGYVISSNTSSSAINAKSTSTTSTSLLTQQKGNYMGGGFKGVVPRSASVGMAKIEEDEPTEFDENVANVMKKKKIGVFPRSMSYGVGGTKKTVVNS